MKYIKYFESESWRYATSNMNPIEDLDDDFSSMEKRKIEELFPDYGIFWIEPYEVSIKSNLIFNGSEWRRHLIEINKKKDDWFWVTDFTTGGSRMVYKCDQLSGLIDLLKHRKYI